jgi:hypothetical protein
LFLAALVFLLTLAALLATMAALLAALAASRFVILRIATRRLLSALFAACLLTLLFVSIVCHVQSSL